MDKWTCPKCGWTTHAHPIYGWQKHNDGAVQAHKENFCPKKDETNASDT
jgi:hypothetical protein